MLPEKGHKTLGNSRRMSRFAPMKRYWILLIIPFLFFACNDPWEKVVKLEEEVMVVHDSSMVKMDAIYTQISQLRKLQEAGEDTVDVDQAWNEKVLGAIADLRRADDGMMDWMANYKAPEKGADVEESTTYLEVEMKKITEVDLEIDESLKNGQSVLDEANSN